MYHILFRVIYQLIGIKSKLFRILSWMMSSMFAAAFE
jgi:hypothetical protein